MLFGPGYVIECVLGVEPEVERACLVAWCKDGIRYSKQVQGIPFFRDNTIGGQPQNKEAAVTNKAEVLTSSNGDARVEKGRILCAEALEAGGAEFKHRVASVPSDHGSCQVMG